MRLEKTIDIKVDAKTTRTFHAYEARPKDIFDAIFKSGDLEASFKDLMGKDLLPLLTDANIDDLKELYPNDVEKLFEAVKAVNAPLLKGLRAVEKLDLGPAIEILRASLINDLVAFAADLLPLATTAVSSTAGRSSTRPLKKKTGAKKKK